MNTSLSRAELTREAILYMRLKLGKPLDSGVKNIPVHCPFHEDKTPSLYIHLEDGVFRCFSCKRQGSIESLFKEYVGESLYKTLGITYNEFSSFANRPQAAIANFEELDKEVEIAVEGNILPYSSSSAVMGYLRRRGIKSSVADAMKFRFAEKVYINKTYFANRLLIPIYEKGKLISIEGRDITGEQKPKVLYPRGSSVNSLYELANLSTEKPLYVVEGLMDLALLRAYPDFANSTAIFGAALTQRQLYLLKKFEKVIVIPDNDSAGFGTIKTLQENKMKNAYALFLPRSYKGIDVKDIGDFVTKASSSLSELISRKWLLRSKPVLII